MLKYKLWNENCFLLLSKNKIMNVKQLFFNACIIGTILSYKLANAQNDLVVFSNNGEMFYLYVNGVKQNPDFETNVRVTNIKQPQVKLRVVFEDNKKIPDLYTNAMLMWEGEEKKGLEFVYQIVNKAGKYKIKPYSVTEIHRESTGDQTVVNYSTEEPAPNISVTSPANTNISLNTQTVTSTSVITTNTADQSPYSNSPNGAVGINISLSPNSAGIQIHDGTTNNSSTSYTTSVVSTTVVSSSSTASENAAVPTTPTTHPKPRTVVKCEVSNTEFENIKKVSTLNLLKTVN